MSTFTDKNDKEYIEVLYNECYGGFGISKEALALYNKKLLERNSTAEIKKDCYFFNRTDPILLEVYHEMDGGSSNQGEGFNRSSSKIIIDKIQKIYKDYYVISEYDGQETVNVDYNRFELKEIKRIANDENLSFEERIKQIQEFKVDYDF